MSIYAKFCVVVNMENAKRFAKFAARLTGTRVTQGLSQRELAQKAGVSHRSLQYWENGDTQPYGDNLRKLSEALCVSVEYLLAQDDVQIPTAPSELVDAGNARIVRTAPAKTIRVPVVSWAMAGAGGSFDDLANQIEEYIDVETSDKNSYAVIIEGDSMMPKFEPGDRVVLSPNSEAVNGDVVVARLRDNGKVYLKLFHRTGTNGETVRLTSFNPAYPPLEFERAKFRFVHPVIEMRRMPRR